MTRIRSKILVVFLSFIAQGKLNQYGDEIPMDKVQTETNYFHYTADAFRQQQRQR